MLMPTPNTIDRLRWLRRLLQIQVLDLRGIHRTYSRVSANLIIEQRAVLDRTPRADF
jgi:hypothetical protein